jgi:hypothetical protein
MALIKAGMDPVEATILITRAGIELAPPADTRTPGAKRQAAWRERLKASQSVSEVTSSETSQNVSNRNETSQSNAASLSKERKKEEIKEKRESSKGSLLLDGWRPDSESWAESVALLGSDDRSEYELKKFKDHALEKGRSAKNWNAAWRNWAKRSVEFGGRNGYGFSNIRADPGAGPAATRDAAVIAGMGRALERRRAKRTADDAGRQDVRDAGCAGTAGGADADRGTATGDDESSGQLAFLPTGHARG